MAFLGLMLMTASPLRPADHSSCMGGFFPEQPLHQALRFGHSQRNELLQLFGGQEAYSIPFFCSRAATTAKNA